MPNNWLASGCATATSCSLARRAAASPIGWMRTGQSRSGLTAPCTATQHQTGDACQPGHIVQWMWDTYVQVAGIANYLTKPGTKWYLVTADYALGHQLEADAKTLATLARTVRELVALDSAAAGEGGKSEDDLSPAEGLRRVEELRRELARRMERLIADHADEAVPQAAAGSADRAAEHEGRLRQQHSVLG